MSISYVNWLRERVGTRKVFLPFVTVIARDEHSRVLMQRRTDFDFWGLPGGVLELDEDLETCGRRELKEETGLEVGALSLVGVYSDPRYDVRYPNGDLVQQFTVCLQGRVNGGVMEPDGMETSEQAFCTLAEIAGMSLPVWYRDMVADAERGGPPVFQAPFRLAQTVDQIAQVRPFIGRALYAGTAASAIVARDDGRVLMLQHKGESAWRPPAGFCELGENVAQTIVRELQEETRLAIIPERIIAVHGTPRLNITYANGDKVKVVGVVFRARLEGGHPTLDNGEVADLAWLDLGEALARVDPQRYWFYERVFAHVSAGHFFC